MSQTVKEFIAEVNKSFGKEHPVMMVAGDREAFLIPRLPTGILPLDWATGGGVPIGAFTRIFGKESSGKSTLSLKLAANAQHTCRTCFKHLELECKCEDDDKAPMRVMWVDVEGTFDQEWSRHMGVNCDDLVISVPRTGEQASDIVSSAIRSELFHLIVIDSIAMMVPSKEIEESAEKGMVGVQPRMVNRSIRDWTAGLNSYGVGNYRRPTVILINQIRMKTDGYGNPETQPGGRAQYHAAMLDISLRSGQPEFKGERPARFEFKFSIPKNKSAPPKMSGMFRMWMTPVGKHAIGDTEEDQEIWACLESFGEIVEEKKGSVKVWNWNGETFAAKQTLTDRLSEPAIRLSVRQKILNALIHEGKEYGHADEDK